MQRLILTIVGGMLAVGVMVVVIGGVLLYGLLKRLEDPPHGAVYVLDVGTQELTKVADDPARMVAWTPDGASIWYTDAGYPGARNTAVKSVEVSSRERRTVVGLGHGGFVEMAPAAGLVAYVTGEGVDLTVRVASVAGQRQSFGAGSAPALSPDGRHLLFRASGCGPQALRVAESSDPGTVATIAEDVDYAGWIGDKEIIYEKETAPALFDAGVVKRAVHAAFVQRLGEDARPVNRLDGMLSPDAQFVVNWHEPYREVFLRDLASGTETNLGLGFPYGDWSPDSQMFVLQLRPTGDADVEFLEVFRRDGAKVFSIDEKTIETHINSDDPGDHGQRQELITDIEWSPDGKRIALGVHGGDYGHPPCGS